MLSIRMTCRVGKGGRNMENDTFKPKEVEMVSNVEVVDEKYDSK